VRFEPPCIPGLGVFVANTNMPSPGMHGGSKRSCEQALTNTPSPGMHGGSKRSCEQALMF